MMMLMMMMMMVSSIIAIIIIAIIIIIMITTTTSTMYDAAADDETPVLVRFRKFPADVPFSCLFGDWRPSHVVRVSFSGRRAVGEREPKSRTRRPCAVSGEFVAFRSTEMAWRKRMSLSRCGPNFWRAGALWQNCQPC